MRDYGKALNSFSQALLSPDAGLQGKSHYNLGNTLYQRGETQKKDDEKLKDWTNALQHYEQSLKIAPENKEAKENLAFVKKKIEELKRNREQRHNPLHPSLSPKPQPEKKNDSQKDQHHQQQQQHKDHTRATDSSRNRQQRRAEVSINEKVQGNPKEKQTNPRPQSSAIPRS